MKHSRRYCGIYVDKFNHDDNNYNKRIYIGGGMDSNNKFEYFDINKNEWYLLPNTNGMHGRWPIIWKDDINIINIASIHKCKKFEKLDLRQNKWSVYIGNDENDLLASNSFDNIFSTTIHKEEYNSRLLIANN